MESNNDKELNEKCASCPKQSQGCNGCSSNSNCGEGCGSGNSCGGGCSSGGCGGCASRGKLNSYDWLSDIPGEYNSYDMVEVQFKNTRKGFYKNSTNIPLAIGDIVAVEAVPGHDIGKVTLTGKLVALQMRKANLRQDAEILRVFRIAKPNDLEKFEAAKARENETMIKSRKIAEDLKLNMKIGDVEYQGDGNKAIFYYIADERVDFRQLIKILADTFKIRVEMKQIGARQEAGRIGGIGPCGRPLCCSSWMTNFVSVSTSAARYQDISLNPQKLAGQCAKLKCCLNFEVDTYVEGVKRMPSKDTWLETKEATYYHFKSDIFKREITYSTDRSIPANLVTLPADKVFEIIALNRRGVRPDALVAEEHRKKPEAKEFGDIIGQDSVTRFDKTKRKKNRNKNNSNGNNNSNNGGNPRVANENAPKNNNNGQEKRQPNQPRPPKQNKGGNTPTEAPQKGNNPRTQNNQGEPSPRNNNNERRRNPRNDNRGARQERNNRNDANGTKQNDNSNNQNN